MRSDRISLLLALAIIPLSSFAGDGKEDYGFGCTGPSNPFGTDEDGEAANVVTFTDAWQADYDAKTYVWILAEPVTPFVWDDWSNHPGAPEEWAEHGVCVGEVQWDKGDGDGGVWDVGVNKIGYASDSLGRSLGADAWMVSDVEGSDAVCVFLYGNLYTPQDGTPWCYSAATGDAWTGQVPWALSWVPKPVDPFIFGALNDNTGGVGALQRFYSIFGQTYPVPSPDDSPVWGGAGATNNITASGSFTLNDDTNTWGPTNWMRMINGNDDWKLVLPAMGAPGVDTSEAQEINIAWGDASGMNGYMDLSGGSCDIYDKTFRFGEEAETELGSSFVASDLVIMHTTYWIDGFPGYLLYAQVGSYYGSSKQIPDGVNAWKSTGDGNGYGPLIEEIKAGLARFEPSPHSSVFKLAYLPDVSMPRSAKDSSTGEVFHGLPLGGRLLAGGDSNAYGGVVLSVTATDFGAYDGLMVAHPEELEDGTLGSTLTRLSLGETWDPPQAYPANMVRFYGLLAPGEIGASVNLLDMPTVEIEGYGSEPELLAEWASDAYGMPLFSARIRDVEGLGLLGTALAELTEEDTFHALVTDSDCNEPVCRDTLWLLIAGAQYGIGVEGGVFDYSGPDGLRISGQINRGANGIALSGVRVEAFGLVLEDLSTFLAAEAVF